MNRNRPQKQISRIFRYFPVFVLLILLSLSVSADTIAGITGIGGSSQKDNTKGFDYSDFPKDIRDKCDEQLRSVIKTCAEKGYENWFVQRDYSGRTFLPKEKNWYYGDVVIGKEICGYSENSIDETYIVTSLTDYMCSNKDFVKKTASSEEYVCSFICSAWDCDEGSNKKEVAGCAETPEKYPGQDPYERQGPGCADGQELMCKERGKKAWWKFWGSSCELERPCYTKDFGGEPVVFCNCSCENKPLESTISQSQVDEIIATAGELSAKVEPGNGCFPDVAIASTKDKVPATVKVDTTRNNADDLVKLINTSPADAIKSGVLEGADTARMAAALNLANDPATSFNTISIVAGAKEIPDSKEVSDEPVAVACKEDWSCRPWTDWGDWSNCDGGVQFRFHSRQCTEKNNCKTATEKPKTSESEKKECGKVADANANSDANAACTENWSCGAWADFGTCTNGTKTHTRTCTDSANCGTTALRPELSESQPCQQDVAVSCTENWSCGEWVTGTWGACQENNTQSRTNTRTCTDANNCGTTSSKPATSQNDSQACTYSPTEQKPEYTQHESTLGNNISTLNWQNGSASFNTASTGGQYGYKILGIPAGKTVKICVAISGGSIPEFHSYPQYHYGYDWSSTVWESAHPGCMTAYNKNAWANGILVHIGDPVPANSTGMITVSEYLQ